MTAKVISLQIKPGIQRDGTIFDAPTYVDGRWVRFQRGRPRKMGGYRGMFLNAAEISRGMIMNSENGENYLYSGSACLSSVDFNVMGLLTPSLSQTSFTSFDVSGKPDIFLKNSSSLFCAVIAPLLTPMP